MNDKSLYAVPLDGEGEEWEFYDDLGYYLDMRIANDGL